MFVEIDSRSIAVEIGPGYGWPRLQHYPDDMYVVGIEPDEEARVSAAKVAQEIRPVSAAVLLGVAEALPLQTASAAVVVTTMVLCSVDSPAAALAEIVRVVRPGGQYRFCEHLPRDEDLAAHGAHCPRRFGCHWARDPRPYLTAAFEDLAFEVHPLASGTFIYGIVTL